MHIDDLHHQQQKQLHRRRDQLLVLLKCFVYNYLFLHLLQINQNCGYVKLVKTLDLLARPRGFEPLTLGLENRFSVKNPLKINIRH